MKTQTPQTGRSIGLRAIRAAYRHDKWPEERDGNWVMAVLYRPISHPIALACLRAGVPANRITGFALALAVTMPPVAGFAPLSAAGALVCVLGAGFVLLDCVDGTVARMSGTEDHFGARFDFLADMSLWGLLYGAIGLLADRTLGTGGAWTALALGAAWLRLLARTVRDARSERAAAGPSSPAHPFLRFLAGLDGALPFLALAGGGLGLAVGALLLYSAADFARSISLFLRSARA